MLQVNIVFAKVNDIYTFYETNKPQIIKLNSKLLDKQLEDLIGNDNINLMNYELVKRTIRLIDITKPKKILNKFKDENYYENEDISFKMKLLLEDASLSGCLRLWSK